MKVTQEDALSVLGKYVEERKPVLAVFWTPSMSVARVTGTIRISMVDGVTAYLIAGKEDRLNRYGLISSVIPARRTVPGPMVGS